jgi:hypothetical protein
MGRITLSEKFFPGIIFFALIGSSLILLYNSATSSVARAPELSSWTLFFIIAVMVAAVAGILYKKKLKSPDQAFHEEATFWS